MRDVATGKSRGRFRGHENWVYSVAFSPNGRMLATGGWDGAVKLWDLKSGQEIATGNGHKGIVLAVAFSPDSRMVASTGYDQRVRLWDMV